MKLKNIGSNMNEVEINGKSVLFSYETPVAGYCEQGAFSCLLYTSPSPRDLSTSRMPSSA